MPDPTAVFAAGHVSAVGAVGAVGAVEDAWSVALAAARRAGVSIRPLDTLAEISAACDLLDRVWQTAPGEPSEVQPPLVRALAHTGNYTVAAYGPDGDGRDGGGGDNLLAVSLGFFGAPALSVLHSHITGVRTDAVGRGVGAAVKWHQRAWTMAAGAEAVTWTYDPLIARNAYFNIHRLGARPVHYLPDFYGLLTDGRNAGQPSDRAMVRWELDAPGVRRAGGAILGRPATEPADPADPGAQGRIDPAAPGARQDPVPELAVLAVDSDGGPVIRSVTSGVRLTVAVPTDIETLRAYDPPLALRWRLTLRDVLGELLTGPWSVTGFRRAGLYVLDPAR